MPYLLLSRDESPRKNTGWSPRYCLLAVLPALSSFPPFFPGPSRRQSPLDLPLYTPQTHTTNSGPKVFESRQIRNCHRFFGGAVQEGSGRSGHGGAPLLRGHRHRCPGIGEMSLLCSIPSQPSLPFEFSTVVSPPPPSLLSFPNLPSALLPLCLLLQTHGICSSLSDLSPPRINFPQKNRPSQPSPLPPSPSLPESECSTTFVPTRDGRFGFMFMSATRPEPEPEISLSQEEACRLSPCRRSYSLHLLHQRKRGPITKHTDAYLPPSPTP
jgi:hypothetical protein